MPLKTFEVHLAKVEKYKRIIDRIKSIRVNKAEYRVHGNNLIKEWFSQVRPSIISYPQIEEHIKSVDSLYQELLPLTLENKLKIRYQEILRPLIKLLKSKILPILISIPTSAVERITETIVSGNDEKLYETLCRINQGIADSYQQVLIDLQDKNRVSFKGTANELREVLREVLDHLAPDDIVAGQPGFQLEQNTNKPTMKQKVRHILSSRGYKLSQTTSTIKTIETIEDKVGALTRLLYSRSSLSTHQATRRAEVAILKNYVSAVLCELLEIA